jgi:predicted RNase H-related nuclease YkuK (DUF458 family)
VASLLCSFKTSGEVYIFHPLIASTKELLKNGNMLTVIACEHSIKRGFIYMVERNNNSKSQPLKMRQMEEFQLSSKYLSIVETLY